MNKRKSPESVMSVVEHLEELRWRIIYSIIGWLIGAILAYIYTDYLLSIFTRHVKKLVFLAPAEAFMIRIKLALIGGLFLALPFILLQVLLFVMPGLKLGEKRLVILLVPAAICFFICGALFANFVVLPIGIRFLLRFATNNLEPMLSISKYFSFVLTLLIACGIIFELPLVVMALARLGIINSGMLRNNWKIALVVILIIAAVVTPGPDVFSQLFLAVPMLVLYQLSIFLARLVEKKKQLACEFKIPHGEG